MNFQRGDRLPVEGEMVFLRYDNNIVIATNSTAFESGTHLPEKRYVQIDDSLRPE
jgi:hypothetical protein